MYERHLLVLWQADGDDRCVNKQFFSSQCALYRVQEMAFAFFRVSDAGMDDWKNTINICPMKEDKFHKLVDPEVEFPGDKLFCTKP